MAPETRYARSGDVNIAYQVTGEGPRDLVYVPGWVSNVEMMWEQPPMARFLERLASFSRLILFDKRGTGLSDRVSNDELPTLERRMDDVRAVLETVGSERAALFGHSEGGNMCVLFAATFPVTATVVEELGSDAFLYGQYADTTDPALLDQTVIARVDPNAPPAKGDRVRLRIVPGKGRLFSAATGLRLPA